MARKKLIISDVKEIEKKGIVLTVHNLEGFNDDFDFKTLIDKEVFIETESDVFLTKVINVQINKSLVDKKNIFFLIQKIKDFDPKIGYLISLK